MNALSVTEEMFLKMKITQQNVKTPLEKAKTSLYTHQKLKNFEKNTGDWKSD